MIYRIFVDGLDCGVYELSKKEVTALLSDQDIRIVKVN